MTIQPGEIGQSVSAIAKEWHTANMLRFLEWANNSHSYDGLKRAALITEIEKRLLPRRER